MLLHLVGLGLEAREVLVETLEPLTRRVVGLLRERDLLDLDLTDAPVDDVDLGRHRVDLDAQPRRGLIDEVDGLVGQEPSGEVPIGEHRGRHER